MLTEVFGNNDGKKIKLDLVDHSEEHGIPYQHQIGEEGAKEEEPRIPEPEVLVGMLVRITRFRFHRIT